MKKTLLMAAATLAAGIISTQATGVYSQNVVGYYNVSLPATVYNLVSVQFSVGVSNGASEVFPNIPDGTEFIQWDVSHATFIYNYFDTASGSTTPINSWLMSDDNTPTNQPVFRPGTSLFVVVPSATNLTIVGTVVNTNTTALVAGYNMAASALPIGGAATNTLFNFTGVPDGTEFMQWDVSHQTYVYNYYDTLSGATTPGNSWLMSDDNTYTNPPTFNVGQGLFIVPPSAYSYTQTYTNQ